MEQLRDIVKIENSMIAKFAQKECVANPKVSIVIPAYNTENFIAKCLLSLIGQTLKDIEIIVVDDGSTDGTLSIVKQFSESDARIKVISQSNQKQGAARNRGVEHARGEYIGFVDSDDWIDFEYYEKLYLAAKKYDSDLALATNVRIGNGKTKKRLNITEEVFVTTLQDKIEISNQAKNPCPTNKIYRKSMLEKNSIVWPEGVYCEDKLYTIQAIFYANGLVTVPGVNYYYFRNLNSTVHGKSKKLVIDKNNARRAVLEFLKAQNVELINDDFWALKFEKRIFDIPIWVVKEYLNSEKVFLFGLKVKEIRKG